MTKIMSDEQAQKSVEWIVNFYEPEGSIITEEIRQKVYKYFTGRITETEYDHFALSKIKPHYQGLSSWIETAFLMGNPKNAERLNLSRAEMNSSTVKKKSYKLDALLVQCDFQAESYHEIAAWEQMKPVGKELL